MAKKAAKGGKKKGAAKKGGKPKGRKPSQAALPTMEQARNEKLDALCESIGKNLDKVNAAKSDVAEDKSEALAEMQRKGTTQHTHYGVTLLRMAGAEKLVMRRTKDGDSGNAAEDDGEGDDE